MPDDYPLPPLKHHSPLVSIDFQDMLMNAPIGVFSSTPEGSFVYANIALARIFGYESPQELIDVVGNIGKALYVDPEDRAEILRLLEANEGLLYTETLRQTSRLEGESRKENGGARRPRRSMIAIGAQD